MLETKMSSFYYGEYVCAFLVCREHKIPCTRLLPWDLQGGDQRPFGKRLKTEAGGTSTLHVQNHPQLIICWMNWMSQCVCVCVMKLKEHPERGVYVRDLSMHTVHSVGECERIMDQGWKNRSVGYTLMNKDSSRSHSIFTIHLEICNTGQNPKHTRDVNIHRSNQWWTCL